MRQRTGGGTNLDGGDEEMLDNRVQRAARYILQGMRLFRVALGILGMLLFLVFVCCVLQSIFIGIDFKSDLSISVKFIEDGDGGGGGGGGGGGELTPTCSDNNTCTADFEFDSGGCGSIPFPEGTPCEGVCAFDQEGTCEYVELQKGIVKAICTSGRCRGTCESVEECPVLTPAEQICEPPCPDPLCVTGEHTYPRPGVNTDGAYCGSPGPASEISEKCYFAPPIESFCLSAQGESGGSCFYRARIPHGAFNAGSDSTGDGFFDTDIQPVIATDDMPEFGCRSDSEFFVNYCMGLISDDDPLKGCLVPIVKCEFRYLNQDLFHSPEERQGDPFIIPECHYHFWCSASPFQ